MEEDNNNQSVRATRPIVCPIDPAELSQCDSCQ